MKRARADATGASRNDRAAASPVVHDDGRDPPVTKI
jgi:hypothetical protein